MIIGRLNEAGIKAMTKPGTGDRGLGWSAGSPRRIYVRARDLERAEKVLGIHRAPSHPVHQEAVPGAKRRFGFLHRRGKP